MRNKRFYFICAITVLFIALIAPNPLSAQSGKNYRNYYGELPTDGQKFTHGLLVLKVTEPAKVDTDDMSLYSCGKVQLVGCNSSDADIEICDTIMTYEKSLDRFIPFEIDGVYSGSDIEVDRISLYSITSMKLGCAGGLSSLRTSGSAREICGIISVSFAPQFNNPTLPSFVYCTQLATIDIPECVTHIPDNCFSSCHNLQSINIPKQVSYIGDMAFRYCERLQSIKLPENLKEIGSLAFIYSGLTHINIPQGVKIGEQAFFMCSNLKQITLSQGVRIGDAAFCLCNNIEQISLSQGVNVGNLAFANCSNINQVTVAKGVNIGEQAFYDCNNIHMTFLDGAIVDSKTFSNCLSLKQITLSQGVNVGNRAFYSCRNLKQVTVAKGVNIGDEAFFSCSNLNQVTLSQGVNIGFEAFAYCSKLKQIEWDDETTIDYDETTIGDYAFSRTAITSLTLPEYVTAVGASAFAYCSSLTSVSLPKNLTTIQNSAFYDTGLTKLDLPDSVKKLGAWAFASCDELTDISFNLDTIDTGAFTDCPKLERIHSKSKKPPFAYYEEEKNGKITTRYSKKIFDDITRETATLYVPEFYIRDLPFIYNGTPPPFSWEFRNVVICQDTQGDDIRTSTNVDDILSGANSEVSIDADGCSLSGAEGMPVSVYTTDGRTVYSTPAYDGSQLPLKRGSMYIIAAGQQRLKVAR